MAQTDPPWFSEIYALLQQNRKLEAIKLFRDKTGLGLKESVEAVQGLPAQPPTPSDTPQPPWLPEVQNLLQ